MTSNREKIFLHYILKYPVFFKNVESHYFKNKEIRFVYELIKKEFEKSKNKIVSSVNEIYDIIKNNDKDDLFSDDLIKSILKIDLSKYREDEYILPNLKSWILINKTSDGIIDSVDKLRDVKEDNPENIFEIINEVRLKMDDATKPDYTDVNIGSDFDSVDDHYQDAVYNKIPTGWETLNKLLGGGLDRKTLNVLMAQTNGGKSLWMQNFAMYAANLGFNVAYITLEMSEKKILKRIGSMRLKIPINDYDELSKDKQFIQERIDLLKQTHGGKSDDLFGGELGKIYVKEFPAGTLTCIELEAYLKKLEEVTNKKIDLLVIDYISLMQAGGGSNKNGMTLYEKGKNLAEGLRSIGQKFDYAVLTATQIAKDKFDANDMTLADMPESKAIAETADTVFAIIRNPIMKIENKYHVKPLKLRDAEFAFDRMICELDSKYLSISNDRIYDTI
jgi:replicative DNA helicase